MRIVLFITLNFCMIDLFGQTVTNGIVCHYPFNNNLTDVSGHNYNLMATNPPEYTLDRFNTSNNALNFSDAWCFNGLGAYSISYFNDTSLSVSFWVKPRNFYQEERYLIDCYGNAPTSFTLDQLYIYGITDNSNNYFIKAQVFNSAVNNVQIQTAVDSNVWSHIGLTIKANGFAKLYLNGNIADSTFFPYSSLSDTTTNIALTNGNTPFCFKGALDELVFYNRTLTASEVNNNYLASNHEISKINDNIDIYPVPVSNILKINLHNFHAEAETMITISNEIGQKVLIEKFKNTSDMEVDVSSLLPGVYFVKIQGNEISGIKKIVK
jgi:hypothetical protein